jgi:hypothetical protein
MLTEARGCYVEGDELLLAVPVQVEKAVEQT